MKRHRPVTRLKAGPQSIIHTIEEMSLKDKDLIKLLAGAVLIPVNYLERVVPHAGHDPGPVAEGPDLLHAVRVGLGLPQRLTRPRVPEHHLKRRGVTSQPDFKAD